jgi:hypothetical protein
MENKINEEIKEDLKSETFFSESVDNVSATGKSKGSYKMELKSYDGHKFIQITQVKKGFGSVPDQFKNITFNPENESFISLFEKVLKAKDEV